VKTRFIDLPRYKHPGSKKSHYANLRTASIVESTKSGYWNPAKKSVQESVRKEERCIQSRKVVTTA